MQFRGKTNLVPDSCPQLPQFNRQMLSVLDSTQELFRLDLDYIEVGRALDLALKLSVVRRPRDFRLKPVLITPMNFDMDSEPPVEPNELEDSSEVVDAIVVAAYDEPDEPTAVPVKSPLEESHQLPAQFQNVSAKGGAVAAIVLGCLAIFGSFVTQWSIFNALIGLPLGLWGLKSSLFRTSMAGICFCAIGLVLCFAMFAK